MWRIALFVFLLFGTIPTVQEASAHAMFNSAESTIGNNRVQIATVPEIPVINEKCTIKIHVTDLDLNDVQSFTMGMRIFYNDKQIDGIPVQTHDTGYWDFDYVFKQQGNHIFRVDLYDADGKVITHTFNMSTQSPFAFIFTYVIMCGAVGLAIIVGYIYLPKRLRKLRTRL
jgi:hypothetical protein